MLALRERPQLFHVGGELGSAKRLDRPGEAPFAVADRQADGLGADVEPGELAAMRQRRGELA